MHSVKPLLHGTYHVRDNLTIIEVLISRLHIFSDANTDTTLLFHALLEFRQPALNYNLIIFMHLD